MAKKEEIAYWQEKIGTNLKDVMGFWLAHSVDRQHGGYFNCLDRDGSVYDTKKHVWLQGREAWMLSRLYNERAEYHTAEVLEAARLGVEFLRTHAHRSDDRVYFCLAQDGKPVQLQRKVFAECFYVMALSEYALAIKSTDGALSQQLFQEACHVFEAVLRFSKDLSLVGAQALDGQTPSHSLAIPMITLNVICELRRYGDDAGLYAAQAEACIPAIMLHVREDLRLVLETVGPNGELLDSPEGRLLNCGHAIEAGWFILDYARKYGGQNKAQLQQVALNMIEWSYDKGWDREHGGIYYFLDRDGRSPLQLEWPMKLWWVHCETMVATLLAYTVTRDPGWWRRFIQSVNYTMSKFPDTEENAIVDPFALTARPGGEWFGYLDREGRVSQRFKGGPYKGCFHVPRALHLCAQLLGQLEGAKKE